MRLTILGAPGAGKGTQALKLAARLNIAHVSTGDLLRRHIRDEIDEFTPGLRLKVARELEVQMRRGDLAPDSVIFDLLTDRLAKRDCENGYILDGFPRNLAQAVMFEEQNLGFDKVIAIIVDDAVIIDRLSGRRLCPKCGKTFHLRLNPSKAGDACDVCGTALVSRGDDNEETVANRLKIYRSVTEPIKEFYSERGLLREVSGEGSVDEISNSIITAVMR